MKKISLIVLIFLTTSIVFGQNKPKVVNFGIQFLDTLSLPSKHNYIESVKLYPIKDKHSKKYYNDPTFNYLLDSKGFKNITVESKRDSLNIVLIPPLKPNRFYKLEITYVGREDLYGAFRDMFIEGNDYEDKTNWMKTIDFLNAESIRSNQPYLYLYQPTNKDLKILKEELKAIDFNSSLDTNYVSNILYKNLTGLKVRQKEIEKNKVIEFCRWLSTFDNFQPDTGLKIFEYFGRIPDHQRLYDFYLRYIKVELVNNPTAYLTHTKFKELVENAIEKEVEFLKTNLDGKEPVPNYITFIDKAKLYPKTHKISSYPDKYETSYERSLVPDFGYITYIPYEGSIKGGSPYVGVHISLSPVNKDVPLTLSQLTFAQRFSIHTAVTLNSLKKDGFRDDFFANYSLMLGGGYKVLTQSTRLNFGGLFFKKTDAVSGNSNIAVQPYVGISIDIEIRKWLEGIIPTFTKNFKDN
ncbi:hypothetical protein [Lacihabitans sp. CS3-21]|uniref:hypothetical protein n=1 Tax=Lacihabitans sp. CS3-21 TaxID=2487332 RepID=UPI0020CCC028|nr:hypothetical protein [Lacihabitans sp. CS3-21]MCP9748604.1 hypothetical protein [Lacihabitans sp. CS3-21]